LRGLVGDPLLVGGLGPGAPRPPKSGPGVQIPPTTRKLTSICLMRFNNSEN